MDKLEILERAINEQKTISFDYKWEWVRTWNPHAIFSSSAGNMNIDIYQINWYSNTNQKIPGWRPFSLAKIEDIDISESPFTIADGYSSNSPKYEKAYCKIQ